MSDRKSVLAIDNDLEILYLLKVALESFGDYTVTTADSGDRGIRYANSQKYDIIISDLVMPDLDGEKVMRAVQQTTYNKDTLLFVLSGKADIAEALQIANVTVLSKPFNPTDLVDRISKAWDLKHGPKKPDTNN